MPGRGYVEGTVREFEEGLVLDVHDRLRWAR